MNYKHDAIMYDFAETWITNEHAPPPALLEALKVELADRIAETVADFMDEKREALDPYQDGRWGSSA